MKDFFGIQNFSQYLTYYILENSFTLFCLKKMGPILKERGPGSDEG